MKRKFNFVILQADEPMHRKLRFVGAIVVLFLCMLAAYKVGASYDNDEVVVDKNAITYCGADPSITVAQFKKKPKLPFQEALYKFTGQRDIIRLPHNITQEQAELLIYAYKVAKADGHKDPSVLQGIIWQESRAGAWEGHEVAGDEYGLKVGKRYYGVGQIKVAAARDVFAKYPQDFPGFTAKTTDEEIIAHLIMDKHFNVRIASKYLYMMTHRDNGTKRPTNFGITAYNQGIGGAVKKDWNKWEYTVAVNQYRDTLLKDFNKENKKHLE